MPRLLARTKPLYMLVLFVLSGMTSQTALAEGEAASDYNAMAEECAKSGAGQCYRLCSHSAMGRERYMEHCRNAYSQFKASQSAPATTSGEEATGDMQPEAVSGGEENALAGAGKVTIMGVSLCSNVVEAGQYLEGQGYKNAAMFANSMRKISVSRREGNNNYDFKINYGGPQKRDAIYLMSFQGSVPDGPDPFESEKSNFEQATGIELTCKRIPMGPNGTLTECKHPSGQADRSRPGFSYRIANQEGQNAFFVDAAAWGYEGCGP